MGKVALLKLNHMIDMHSHNRLISFLQQKRGVLVDERRYFLDSLYEELLPCENQMSDEQEDVFEMLKAARESNHWNIFYSLS